MTSTIVSSPESRLTVSCYQGRALAGRLGAFEEYALRGPCAPLSRHPGWLAVLERAFGHKPYVMEATAGGHIVGYLPLAYVHSLFFGRYLVSLPYLNYGGVMADGATIARVLVDQAVGLAEQLSVRHLELRHEQPLEHAVLGGRLDSKVHMRLRLPAAPGQLWESLSAKVRNQVRKGQKSELSVVWGAEDLLPEFHAVFSHNMRDLGTPTYGRGLFRAVLRQFPGRAELCVVRAGRTPVAGAILLHGQGVTEVPSASSLRQYNPMCANMLMYWHLLGRAVERGQAVFDFGRSTRDSTTFRFKKQWGALPAEATWQYALRNGSAGDMRPDNPKYQRLIRWWQRLPLSVSRCLGPWIVRGIP